MVYGLRARVPCARGRLAHACAMRSGAHASELLYASVPRYTVHTREVHVRARTARSCMCDEKWCSHERATLPSTLVFAEKRQRAACLLVGVSIFKMPPFVPRLSVGHTSKCAVLGLSTAVRCTFLASEPSKAGLVRRAGFW